MKKMCVIMVVVMILAATLSTSLSATAASKWYRGDVDNDNVVAILDATWIQRKLGGMSTANKFNEKAGDVDGLGDVSIVDATLIQRYVANMANPYNIGALVDPYELPVVPNN